MGQNTKDGDHRDVTGDQSSQGGRPRGQLLKYKRGFSGGGGAAV
jgi:hypothetical protein